MHSCASNSCCAQGHAGVNRSLVDITRGVSDVVNLVRKEAALISAESSRSHRAVGHARHGLDTAFAEHRRACRYSSMLQIGAGVAGCLQNGMGRR